MNTQHPSTSPAQPDLPAPRSEGLLPADGADEQLEVAEEVSLDLQSDSARQVGAMPREPAAAQALAATLAPAAGDTPLGQAIERAVPPSA